MSRSYLIITPCRDEAEFLHVTIRTIAAQSVLPTKWLIVDDGSTDDTPDILAGAERKYDFIEVLRREDRGERRVGPGVIETFYSGLDHIDLAAYDYVCKLDGDLELPHRYFETVIEQFERDPYLGTFSGKTYIRSSSGRLTSERLGDENSIGQAKFYRVACFRDIGGFVRQVSWDGIDGHTCRMKGWVAASEDRPELRIIHLRQMGASHKGIWTGRLRWGMGKWFMGSSLLYVAGVAAYRALERPLIVGGLGILVGYLRAMLTGKERYADRDFREFLRQYEHSSLLRGKRATTAKFNERVRRNWQRGPPKSGD